ncbi:MAG: oligosaccharide flippase family protein [Hyphomicrobiaceae bacterium]|nr:oligosaccharide flippase family protein [Hyphomicrobiaceae bacterium]
MRYKPLPLGEFAKNVITLTSGALVAQAIPIAVSPILTRFYSPADFGIFAVYTALAAIITVASTGRFELALNLPRSDLIAIHLFVLASLCVAVTALCVAAILAILFFLVPNGTLNWTYGLLPISILFSGATQIFTCWLNRLKCFRDIAVSRSAQGAAFAAAGIYFGGQGTSQGLILGFLVGQLICVTYLVGAGAPRLQQLRVQLRNSMLTRTATRYRDFPRMLILAHVINIISLRLPVLLMPVSFGAAAAGLYSLSQQVIGLPMQLVGAAVSDVFRQQASVEYKRTGSCVDLYFRTFRAMALLYLPPFLVLVVFSPDLFSFVFGEEWYRAGVLTQILAPMYYMQFVSSALSSMFIIAEKQRYDLLWQLSLIVVITGALILGWLSGSIEICTMLFSVGYCVMYSINLCLTFGFAKSRIVQDR